MVAFRSVKSVAIFPLLVKKYMTQSVLMLPSQKNQGDVTLVNHVVSVLLVNVCVCVCDYCGGVP